MNESSLNTLLENISKQAIRENLILFTEWLGYDNAPFHEDWYNFLQNRFSPLKTAPQQKKKYLLLWPRGHGKTTNTAINYSLWQVGNHPDIHINLVTKTASLAEEILTAIISHLEGMGKKGERYIELFGNLKPQRPKKWTSREIIVARDEISKNPTLKATGLMGPITGGRSDLIICDDIIDEENVRTRLQLEKVSTWFNKVLYPTLYPWGGIIVIGTRWSYADIYAELLPEYNEKGEVTKANWHPNVDIKKAIINEKTKRVLWPSYWSYEKLQERRNEIGSIYFNCQYQNDPTLMEEGDLLKKKWLQPWERPPLSTIPNYAGIDPSLGEGDYFGIATLAHDRRVNQGYLKDVWAEPMPFPLILKEKLPQLHNEYHYVKIFVETNFWQKILTFMLELRGLPIVPVQTMKNKEARFISMSSHFESKRVLVNPLLLRHSEFLTEWVQFPRGQHDDGLDCVEIVTRNVIGKPVGTPAFKLF